MIGNLRVRARSLFRYLRESHIFKAYFTSLLGVFSGLLTQLLYIRELTKVVSADSFSLYAFVFQIITYLSVLQLGLDFTVSREIAINLGRKNLSLANYSYSFITRFNRKVVYVCIALIAIAAFLFYFGVGIPRTYNTGTATLLVLVFGVFQIFSFYIRPYSAALIGANFQNIVNTNIVIINILSTLFGYILLKLGFGLYALPISMSVWSIANVFIIRSLTRKKCKWITKEVLLPNKSLDRASLKFGLTGTLGGIAWTIEATADVILLNAAGLMNLVGLYVIWWRFPQMLFDLATRLTTSAFPSIATAHGVSTDRSTRILSKLTLIACGSAFIISAGIIFWLPSFINLWVGPKYFYPDFKNLAFLMSVLVFFRIVGNCFSLSLISMGKINITSLSAWIQAITKIVLGLLVVSRYQLEGLILVSVLCALIQVVVLGSYLVKNVLIEKRMLFLIGILILVISSLFLFKIYMDFNIVLFTAGAFLTAILALLVWFSLITLFGYRKLLFNLI